MLCFVICSPGLPIHIRALSRKEEGKYIMSAEPGARKCFIGTRSVRHCADSSIYNTERQVVDKTHTDFLKILHTSH